LTQSREGREPFGTLALSARSTGSYLARLGVTRCVTRRLVRHLANRTIPDDTRSYRSALKRRRSPATKQPSRKYERLPARACHPSASALQVLALQDLALDARAALRHSVGTPIPVFHITRSLIRKHRLHGQRKKDDRLRRSRNTLLPRNNRIQGASILNQSCVRDSHLESILLRLVLASETKPAGPQKGARHRHACA
jgi:hypothetical protein